jgi:Tfp pilus assembly protein PilN
MPAFWNRLSVELAVVMQAPFLFLLCVIVVSLVLICFIYLATLAHFRELSKKRDEEIDVLKSEILLLKVRLASRSES